MLLSVRRLLSAEYPRGVDGRYYWQHCAWMDDTDFANNAQMGLAWITDAKLLYTSQVQIHSTRWLDPETHDVEFQQTYTFPQFGSLTAQSNYSLLLCARWKMHGVDGSYTYHLHRQPIGEAYLENGGYSALGLVQQQTRMNTYIAQDIYRTSTGALIDQGEVAERPVQWQLRHGTKRRERRGWLDE